VNGFDAWIETPAGRFELTSQHYAPDVVGGDGAQRIEQFTADPWPRWTFKFADGTRIEQEILVAHESQLTQVAWRLLGNPWFTDWGRDTFIALRGLCLATGRLADAREILLAWANSVSEGMLPNRFPDHGEQPEYNSVDASLWYVVAVHELLQAGNGNSGVVRRGQTNLAGRGGQFLRLLKGTLRHPHGRDGLLMRRRGVSSRMDSKLANGSSSARGKTCRDSGPA
jgi:hypothetical protein